MTEQNGGKKDKNMGKSDSRSISFAHSYYYYINAVHLFVWPLSVQLTFQPSEATYEQILPCYVNEHPSALMAFR